MTALLSELAGGFHPALVQECGIDKAPGQMGMLREEMIYW